MTNIDALVVTTTNCSVRRDQITKCLFCHTDLEDDFKQLEDLQVQRNKMRGLSSNLFPPTNTYQAWCPNKNCDYLFYARLRKVEEKTYRCFVLRTASYIVFLDLDNGKAMVYKNIEGNPMAIRFSGNSIFEFDCSEEEFTSITEDKIKTYILFS